MAVNYGFFANATSLNLIAKKIFLELGNYMNQSKSFTIAATFLSDSQLGDINNHYDCVHIPNMGGYKFPLDSVLQSQNLIIGLSGIDEIILGREVFPSEKMWKLTEPLIKHEIKKWEQHIDQIKFIQVNTNSEKQQMNQYLKIPEEKMHVIPLGVDHKTFHPSKDKESTRKKILSKFKIKNIPYFMHISELNLARKNILRILEAFKKAKNHGLEHSLIIVGKNNPEIVIQKAKGIPDVHVLGYVSEEDLSELIQGSEALLYPSLHEAWGFPMVESMACGIPVITSNLYSMPEVTNGGALLVDPYSTKDICTKILEIAKNERLREVLSHKALRVSKEYSWERTAKEYLNLCNKIDSHLEFDYENSYDMSAYRTLVTVVKIKKSQQRFVGDLLKFDFSNIIEWSLSEGINDYEVGDFLKPFKNWMTSFKK